VTLKPDAIALVDDDCNVRISLHRLLQAMDFTVASFCSAEEFLADTWPGRFSGLVLDVHLTGMSGLELYNQLHATGQRIPTLFISAAHDAERAVAESACAETVFLAKPFDAERLRAALHQTLAGQSTNGTPSRTSPT
jgi:FixJ family two-component response regulator